MGPEKRNPRRLPGHVCIRKSEERRKPAGRKTTGEKRRTPPAAPFSRIAGPPNVHNMTRFRLGEKLRKSKGRPGIEPGYSEPQSDVLPLNYLPAAHGHNPKATEDYSSGNPPVVFPFLLLLSDRAPQPAKTQVRRVRCKKAPERARHALNMSLSFSRGQRKCARLFEDQKQHLTWKGVARPHFFSPVANTLAMSSGTRVRLPQRPMVLFRANTLSKSTLPSR
ncbi:hypothetical protein TcYC6_0019660 [Trypanosoma cruzi]|nr:hypothetical protein TcYC6_0019660 [Trypanosoma cruzi]